MNRITSLRNETTEGNLDVLVRSAAGMQSGQNPQYTERSASYGLIQINMANSGWRLADGD
jgi:hypothetical protein